ncbi:hypothetical protein, partial [Acinetobacter baumannii]
VGWLWFLGLCLGVVVVLVGVGGVFVVVWWFLGWVVCFVGVLVFGVWWLWGLGCLVCVLVFRFVIWWSVLVVVL